MGIVGGALLVGALYTSGYMAKIKSSPMTVKRRNTLCCVGRPTGREFLCTVQ